MVRSSPRAPSRSGKKSQGHKDRSPKNGVAVVVAPKPAAGFSLPKTLAEVAAAYQSAAVIPHCPTCLRPCCGLEALVLELDWRQVKGLWQIEMSRQAFDRQLASGQGPEEIRAGNGLYYAHRKPCPVYDTATASCRVYDQEIKPSGCSDFPVYEDGGEIMADLRCEAVDIEALENRLAAAFGPDFRIVRTADASFSFLVSLAVQSQSRGRKRR